MTDMDDAIKATGFNDGIPAPHVQRMLDEHNELYERHDKLATFFGSTIYASLPQEDQELLCLQYEAMSEYLRILKERLDRVQA